MENSNILNSLSLIAEKDDSADSLGILSMDKLSNFSDDGLYGKKEVNEKLKSERMKALKTLELFECNSQRDQTKNMTKTKKDSIRMIKTPDSYKAPKTPGFDRTDYISYNSYKTLNITDLQAEHTINLESTGKLITPVPNKISFEPSEITGRSTLYRGEVAARKNIEELTVEEILSSSYSGNVRNLGQSLRLNSIGNTDSQQSQLSSISSLPKTADISRKTSDRESLTQNTNGFSFTNARRADESDFLGESFTPAELMSSKFHADELAWAQEHRTIPTNYNTSYTTDVNKSVNKKNTSDFSINSAFDGNNISQLTDFFRKRSENLYDNVSLGESPKYHEPVALIDDTISSTMSNFPVSESDTSNCILTNKLKPRKINDKTYSRKSICNIVNPKEEEKDESYILSLSSIANALKHINSDESGTSIMNRLLAVQRTKSGLNPTTENLISKNSIDSKKSYSLDPKNKLIVQSKKNHNENKENVNPINNNNNNDNNVKPLCDTATFTESLLDTSDFKRIVDNDETCDVDKIDRQSLINIIESTQNALRNFSLSPSKLHQIQKVTKSKQFENIGRSSKSPSSQLNVQNANNKKIINRKTILSSKNQLLSIPIEQRRSKSPTNLNELYAAGGASLKTIAQPITRNERNRKRSRSASNHSNNLHLPSPVSTPANSPRKLLSYPNSPNSIINDHELSIHSPPKVSNPTGTINSIREVRKKILLKKAHSSTRLNNESSEIRSLSPNFHGTCSDFRSPSPIPTSEKSKYINSPISSVYNSPKSIMSSPKYHNSPNSLETTTNSERRYLMATGNHHCHQIPSSVSLSPDFVGKMSLPNYGLITRQPSNLKPSRCNSQCSSSSEFSHHDDKKLPIKVTCMQFSWGSVKLRTNNKKSMQIKNFSSKRLVLRVQISGPGFQIVNLENGCNLITLQSQECRSIIINFCPTVLGVAIGKLCFLSPHENSNNQHKIPLYGYGGHAVVMPQGIQKGPIGLPFITMGELQDLTRPLVRTFTIYNKGPLNAFIVICLSSLGLDIPRLCDSIDIEPKKALIQSDDIVKFRIIFKPRRDDLKRIIKKISGVMTLATLRIITGDEPTRQRIRNIICKMNDNEKSKITSASLDNCWRQFEQEVLLNDINVFKEQTDVAMELVSTFRTHEIALTLNHTVMDDTTTSSHLMFPDVDETIMFRTIVSNSIYLKSPSNEIQNNYNIDKFNNEQEHNNNNELWSVRPNKLEIDPFDKRIKSFTIRSFYNTKQDFEVTSNFKHLFTINPSSGKLLPNERIEINVNFNHLSFLPKEQINILVFLENDKITIPVQIKTDNLPPNLR